MNLIALRSCVVGTTLVHVGGCELPTATLGRWNDDDGEGGSIDDDAGTSAEDPTMGAPESCRPSAVEFVECPTNDPAADAWDATVEWTYGEGHGSAVAPLVGPFRPLGIDAHDSVDVLIVMGDADKGGPCRLERVTASGDGEIVGDLVVACRVAPAFGDIDGDCVAEVVVAAMVEDGPRLAAIEPDGDVDWIATGEPLAADPIGAVALHDLDGDGRTEVLFAGTVYDHEGVAQWSYGDPTGGRDTPHAVDVDGDDALEIVTSQGVWTHDGDQLLDLEANGSGARVFAIDSERDGDPELWVQTSAGLLVLEPATGEILGTHAAQWQQRDVTTAIVDDLDGDGWPELLGVWNTETGGSAVAVMWWPQPPTRTVDEIWAVLGTYVDGQPTAFDLDGDGKAEAIIASASGLVVVDGPVDVVTLPVAVSPSRGPHVMPVVADVDGDASAEILVVSEDGPALTVVGHARGEWAAARPLWNQFASSVTNVGHDGSIPTAVVPNWSELNTFGTNARVDDGRLCTRAGPT